MPYENDIHITFFRALNLGALKESSLKQTKSTITSGMAMKSEEKQKNFPFPITENGKLSAAELLQ